MQVNRCFGCMEETASNLCPYCGNDQQKQNIPEYVLQPGTILYGKYLIGNVLGQGGFGVTYIGWDLALNRKVAIKEYFPAAYVSRNAKISTQLQWYHTERSREARSMGPEMFLKEARKMNRADAIPQVVHVLDMFQDNQTTYIIMNYVHGETLAKKVTTDGPMPWQKVREILLQVAETMQKVHDTGLIHRDLSPENLMIQPDGNVMILDLGAAKDQHMHGSVSSMQVARGGFSPMEQYAMSGKLGTWTDVYSLSASVYYALTGVIPPSAVDRMDRDLLCWDLPQLRRVPASVIQILQNGMALQVEDRIKSMRTLSDSLRRSKTKRRGKLLAGIAAAALAVVVLFAWTEKQSAVQLQNQTEISVESKEASETSDELWANNVLMSTVIPQSFSMDKDMASVFNRNIARYQILSVTFLDSLDDVGSDSWDVSQARDGSVIAWVEANGTVTNWINGENKKSDAYALYIAADNGINGKFCANLFSGFLNLKSVEFNGCFHTDYSESMENMFENCLNLKILDLHGLKTDSVRNMAGMFRYSGVTTLDLQDFQTNKVEDMSGMFENCSDLEALELCSFDTSKVKDMSSMFSMTGDLTNLDISSFDTSSVTDMSFMFSYMDITELDLSHFNTSHLKNMSYMFSGSDYLKTLDVRGFNTNSVTNMNGTFKECKNLETLLGVAEWDMSSVEYYNNFMDEGIKVDGKPWQNLFE